MLEKIIKEKLPIITKKMSEAQFGKRNYIGASDISKCERQFVMSKLKPEVHNTETLIQFYRGHIAELLLKDVFGETQYKWDYQKQLTYNDIFKVTVDFMFYTKNYSKVGVVECKTVSTIPTTPYENWVLQLYAQMGVIKNLYPNAEIKGSIFCINLNTGEIKEFNGFEHNQALFETTVCKAQRLWDLWQQNDIENASPEKSILCSYCQYRTDCPTFQNDNSIPDDVMNSVVTYKELNAEKKSLDKKLSNLKDEILGYTGNNFEGSRDGITLKVTKTADTKIIDSKKLKAEMPNIFEQYSKVKKGYVKIEFLRENDRLN
jgi:CRISPR-associated exonuclease Cas4